MKLIKAKKLAKDQIGDIVKLAIDVANQVSSLDQVHTNEELTEKLKELKKGSNELFKYFIENAEEETQKNKDMNERCFGKFPEMPKFEHLLKKERNINVSTVEN